MLGFEIHVYVGSHSSDRLHRTHVLIESIDLLRIFYLEFMVDHATFLAWLVKTLTAANLAQAAFLTRLAEDYLDEMYTCRALLKPFVDACLTKLQEVCWMLPGNCLLLLRYHRSMAAPLKILWSNFRREPNDYCRLAQNCTISSNINYVL